MNTKLVEDIAAAVLYEGYMLYPYRASAIKNRQRWNFGVVEPKASMLTECLVKAGPESILHVRIRFLQLTDPPSSGSSSEPRLRGSVQCAKEQDIVIPPLHLPASETVAWNVESISATIEVTAQAIDEGLFKLHVEIRNTGDYTAASRDETLIHSLVSTHSILNIEHGEFISLLDPPDELRETASACRNIGAWPVLVGENGERDAMLASPIILYDYPAIAPESPGALFDGTEIDEILTLRILTLTDEEKREMAQSDERTREILERTEAMPPEQFMKLHGILRTVPEQR